MRKLALSEEHNEPAQVVTRKSKFGVGKKYAPYLFAAPYFIIYFGFTLFSVIFNLVISLNKWTGVTKPVFVGFDNYISLLKDPLVLLTFKNTIIFMISIIPIQLALGLFVALVLTRKNMIFKDFFRLIVFLPYLMTPVAMGLFFAIMFEWNNGVINNILTGLGIIKEDIYWLGEAGPARWMVSMIVIWKYFGYTAVLLMAGLNNVNPEIQEAADIDGANAFNKFIYITIPQIKNVIIFVIITTMIGCFQIFEEPYMMFTGTLNKMVGGPDNSVFTVVWNIMETSFSMQRFGAGAALSYLMFIFVLILSVFSYKILNKGGEN